MNRKRKPKHARRTVRFEALESRNPLAVSSVALLTAVQPLESPHLRVRLETSTLEGDVVDSVSVDETFLLNLFVEDVSDDPEGVFTTFLDVSFDPERVEPLDILYGSDFPNFHYGRIDPAGELRQVGGGAALQPLGEGEFLLASVPFMSRMEGPADFVAQMSEGSLFEPLLFGESLPVDNAFFSTRPAKVEVFQAVVSDNDPILPSNPVDVDDDQVAGPTTIAGKASRQLRSDEPARLTQTEVPEELALVIEVREAVENSRLKNLRTDSEIDDELRFANTPQIADESVEQLERRARVDDSHAPRSEDVIMDDLVVALEDVQTLVLEMSPELPFVVADDDFTIVDTIFAWLPLDFDSADGAIDSDDSFTLNEEEQSREGSEQYETVFASWSIPSITDAMLVVTVGAAIAYRDLKKERDKAEQEAVYVK